MKMRRDILNYILFGSTCGMTLLSATRHVPENYIGIKERDGKFFGGEPLMPGTHIMSPFTNLHYVSTRTRHGLFYLDTKDGSSSQYNYSYRPNIAYLKTEYVASDGKEPSISNYLHELVVKYTKTAELLSSISTPHDLPQGENCFKLIEKRVHDVADKLYDKHGVGLSHFEMGDSCPLSLSLIHYGSDELLYPKLQYVNLGKFEASANTVQSRSDHSPSESL